jgi:hypothetical protein
MTVLDLRDQSWNADETHVARKPTAETSGFWVPLRRTLFFAVCKTSRKSSTPAADLWKLAPLGMGS